MYVCMNTRDLREPRKRVDFWNGTELRLNYQTSCVYKRRIALMIDKCCFDYGTEGISFLGHTVIQGQRELLLLRNTLAIEIRLQLMILVMNVFLVLL